GEATERVERGDVRALRRVEDLEREERHERLVVVDDVELLALEHARHQPLEAQRERDAADAAVERHRHRATDLDHVLRRRVVAPGCRDDAHLVSEAAELLVALADVRVRPARARIGVRTDDADLHYLSRPLRSACGGLRLAASPAGSLAELAPWEGIPRRSHPI